MRPAAQVPVLPVTATEETTEAKPTIRLTAAETRPTVAIPTTAAVTKCTPSKSSTIGKAYGLAAMWKAWAMSWAM